jgi:predicted alpha-1,2-mannosidase
MNTHPRGEFMNLPMISVRALAIVVAIVFISPLQSARAQDQDRLNYCNAVQNKVGFIRYPLGAIGAWSTAAGEAADVMTRVPRIYPCVDRLALKVEKEDWRSALTGDPSMLSVQYHPNKPSGASAVSITLSPHVAVFKTTFPETASERHLVFNFRKVTVDTWARLFKWTDRTVTRLDDRTFQATVSEPGSNGAFYVIRFSVPCVGFGTIDASGKISDGATTTRGAEPVMFARFASSPVTVAVAESFTSLKRANDFLAAEFTDFESVRQRCRSAWNEVLNRVEVEGSDTNKRMAYTALYTMYANIIDGSDGSHYAGTYARPRSVASSAYWQFIGGYQSCCWDNVRATYPFLIMAYPEVMTDVVNTYLARYQRDGCLDGDICLFSGPSGHNNIRLVPELVAQAYCGGVPVDYAKLYAALRDNFADERFAPASLRREGYLLQPDSGGFACSRTLEFDAGFHALAMLARIQHDAEGAKTYLRLGQCYTNLWDSANQAFRVKDAAGRWGPIENSKMTWNPNPQGLFEGSTRDWRFFLPHDPYGLLNLPGQEGFARRLVDYCLNDAWFNDYQEAYPYLLYYAGAPNQAQQIIRRVWVPLFEQGVMYEGVRPKPPHNGWQTHYSGVSGWLLCSMLGLYPSSAPAGQLIISSPSVTKAVIHTGRKDIIIETKNNDAENSYIRSIRVDGKVYPAYMIPAQRLAGGARIELEMGSDPSLGVGDLYVSSSDGFIQSAQLSQASRLKFTVEAAVANATTKVYSRTEPAKVLVNDREDHAWRYDPTNHTATIQTAGTADVEVE